MFSTDRSILSADSDSQKRMLEYGKIFDELHIIVLNQGPGAGNRAAGNVFFYPVNIRFKPLYFWRAYQIGKKIIRNRKLDIGNSVITAQDPFETGLVGWLLKIKFRLPLQLQIHTDVFSPYFGRESFKNKLRVLLAKFLLPKADGIRAVSERIKQSLTSNVRGQLSNVSVLPIFVDIEKIRNENIKTDLHKKYPNYDFIILMASRLTMEKNIGMAIEAMREIVKKYPKTLLLVVGEGPESDGLKVQSQKLKVNNNVIFENWTEDLISYYKTADLFLLTSNYEGYGRTVIEAMAAELPVAMADVGLAGELLINDLNGRVVPIENSNVLAETILELKENPAKREKFEFNSSKLLVNWPVKREYLEKYRNSLELKKMLK